MSTEQNDGVTETTDHLKLWWFIIKKEKNNKYLFKTNIICGNKKSAIYLISLLESFLES